VTVLPTATFTAPATVAAGQPFTLTLSNAQVPGHPDVTDFTYAFDCGDGLGYADPSSTASRSCPTSGAGSRSVKGKVIDPDLDFTEYTATVEVTNNPLPAAPTSLVATAASGPQIDLTWSDNSSDETHFQLERRIRPPGGEVWPAAWDGVADNLAPGTETYSDTAFSPGSQAQYRIRACRDTLCSDWVRSTNVDLRGFFAPPAPTAVEARASAATQIAVTWTQPAGEVAVDFYELERRQTSGTTSAWGAVAASPLAGSASGYEDTGGLQPNTRYRYRIRGCNAYGCSEWTSSAQVFTLP
jgi:hypothetical protein